MVKPPDSLLSLLESQWHPTKNGNKKFTDFSYGSNYNAWWECQEGHEWQVFMYSRSNIKHPNGCPYCSGRKSILGINDFVTTHPELSKEFHLTKNGELKPEQFSFGSDKKVWWLGKCGHEWQTSFYNRSIGKGCVFCAGREVLIGFNDLQSRFPKIAKEWHSTKNGELTPEQVTFGSGKNIWWECDKGHEWKVTVAGRTLNNAGCPYCSGHKTWPGFNDIFTTHPDIASKWHPTLNGELKPSHFSKGTHTKVWWLCDKGHHYLLPIRGAVRGYGCAVCAGKQIIVGVNDLTSVYPAVIKFWHHEKNGELTPEQITFGSHKKVWWLCDKGHEWNGSASSIVRATDNCPKCYIRVSKGEQQLCDFIVSLGLVVEQSNRKILKGKELDIYIPELKVAVEFNGVYWHSKKGLTEQSYHFDKFETCRVKGIELIQIWDDDWRLKRELVEQLLREKLTVVSEVPLNNIAVEFISSLDANTFLTDYHLLGLVVADKFVGVYAVIDLAKTLVSVAAFNVVEDSLVISRFASVTVKQDCFFLLTELMGEFFMNETISFISDNCFGDGGFLKANGFVVDNFLPVDELAVVAGVRKSINFDDIIFDTVWDAGKTLWVKN